MGHGSIGVGNYAKAMRVYLQQMSSLLDTHPWLHEQFMKVRHSIRRSDRYWSGLSCDIVIEVRVMRSIKGRGGLTRGRGIHETVRTVWVNTMTECAQVHVAMSRLRLVQV